MTAVERAKRFLLEKSRTIALTAIPLAALAAVSAPPARAGIVMNPGSVCTASGLGASLNSGAGCQFSALAPLNGNTGIKVTGDASAVSASGGILQISFTGNGTASGSFTGGIPIHWDFNLSENTTSVINWAFEFVLQSSSGSATFETPGFPQNGQAFTGGNGTVSGSATMDVNLANVKSWSFAFYENVVQTSSGDSLGVDIPAKSIDINSQGTAGTVPEPSTWLMVTSAIAGLLWWRRGRNLKA